MKAKIMVGLDKKSTNQTHLFCSSSVLYLTAQTYSIVQIYGHLCCFERFTVQCKQKSMELRDAEPLFLPDHYSDKALRSKGFSGRVLLGTISFHLDEKASGYGWVVVLTWCIFLAGFRRGISVCEVKAYYHFSLFISSMSMSISR